MLTRKALLLIKKETTSGQDASPVKASDAVIAYDVDISPEVGNQERPHQGSGLSRLQEVIGNMKFKISFSLELRGSGTAGTAPRGLGAALQAAGHSETLVGGTSATYAPISASIPTVTIYAYVDGKLYKCVGTSLNASFEIPAGERAMVKFEGESLYQRPTDSSYPTDPTFDTTLPLVGKNMTVYLDSYAAVIKGLNFSPNNTVTPRKDLNQTWGWAVPNITDRNPGGEITIEDILLATKDYWAKFDADTLMELSVIMGATAGNIVTINASYVRLRGIPMGDEDGIRTTALPFQMAMTPLTDGSEYTIVFT